MTGRLDAVVFALFGILKFCLGGSENVVTQKASFPWFVNENCFLEIIDTMKQCAYYRCQPCFTIITTDK